MKNPYPKIIFFTILICIFCSCEKEQDDSLTEQVSDIESTYNSNVKKYVGIIPGYDKGTLESESCSLQRRDSIIAVIQSNLSKTRLKFYGPKAGVLVEAGPRDQYGNLMFPPSSSLQIIMDCEDSNPNSHKGGWTASSIINGQYNVELVFYIIDLYYFTFRRYYYSIFVLSKF